MRLDEPVRVSHDFNRAILHEVAHRPWPVPSSPWVMTQTWHDLLFAHWRVDAEQLRSRVPRQFALDLFDGEAWLGIVPFHMTNVEPRGLPLHPWISAFPELNVRTYVRVADRPGVYFFSLDAGNAMAVRTARALLNLPYHTASMTVTPERDAIVYHSRRRNSQEDAELRAIYRPMGPPSAPTPGSLEYFLTERYCLYNINHRGEPYRLEIHHPPWLLQPTAAEFLRNTMGEANGLTLPAAPPILHFSRRQDMVGWGPTSLAARA